MIEGTKIEEVGERHEVFKLPIEVNTMAKTLCISKRI